MQHIVTIERLGTGSEAIAHLENGKTVFVAGAAPGDVAAIDLVEEKASFARAKLVSVQEPGASRVRPECPYADLCGGCPWQHVSYDMQLEAKRANIVEALVRTSATPREVAEQLVNPVLGSKRQWGYRNKLELGCGKDAAGRLEVGLRNEGSHDIFTPDVCPLAHKPIQKAAKAMRGALRYLQGNQDLGIFRVGVRGSVRTKDVEIALWTTPGPFPRAQAAKILGDALKNTSVVRVMADPGKARKIKGVETLSGKGCWEEHLAEADFLTSAPAFFQVNTAQAEKLVNTVIDHLNIEEGSFVADLYSGGGTFSIPLAMAGADVVAVETVGASVRDLRRNADRAGVWVDVIGDDAARALPTLGHLDALVVDPPRAGLAKGVAEDIAKAGPEKMAYVSCDPQTWARDVARLRNVGYELSFVQPVDMFPQTYHCEVVSIFSRK